MRTIKVDLSVSPHFYSPQSGKRVPSLKKIVDGIAKKDLGIVALTSCHTATSGIDNRFNDYMKQLGDIAQDWDIDYNAHEGVLSLSAKRSPREFKIMHTQKVRAYEGERPAYVLVAGLGEIIMPTRDITDTAKEVKDKGGIVLIPDPDTPSCATFHKAVEIYKSGFADSVQISATTPEEQNNLMRTKLIEEEVRSFPSSNAKRYQDAGTSYATIQGDINNTEELGKIIRNGEFGSAYGQMSRWQVFLSRDIHILLSLPGHFFAGGKRREEMQRATGLKKE